MLKCMTRLKKLFADSLFSHKPELEDKHPFPGLAPYSGSGLQDAALFGPSQADVGCFLDLTSVDFYWKYNHRCLDELNSYYKILYQTARVWGLVGHQ